jgi:hypothetical protein
MSGPDTMDTIDAMRPVCSSDIGDCAPLPPYGATKSPGQSARRGPGNTGKASRTIRPALTRHASGTPVGSGGGPSWSDPRSPTRSGSRRPCCGRWWRCSPLRDPAWDRAAHAHDPGAHRRAHLRPAGRRSDCQRRIRQRALREGFMLSPGNVFRPHLEPTPRMRSNVAVCDELRVLRWMERIATTQSNSC